MDFLSGKITSTELGIQEWSEMNFYVKINFIASAQIREISSALQMSELGVRVRSVHFFPDARGQSVFIKNVSYSCRDIRYPCCIHVA